MQYLNRKRTKGKASETNKTQLTKMMDLSHILLQWNVQGINSSKEDLVKLIDDLEPSILAIQETFQANSSVTNLLGYNWVATEGHYWHRYHGGVTLYIHNVASEYVDYMATLPMRWCVACWPVIGSAGWSRYTW